MLPIISFTKGTSLKQIIGTNTIHNNDQLIKTENNHDIGKCVWCNSTRCLFCQQLISTTTFKSYQPKKNFKIYHKLNCKSRFVIYLQECYICSIQYTGKWEIPFNIKLNNHRKAVKNPNAIPACKHFNRDGHGFNNHGKIIIIEQLRNIWRKTIPARKLLNNETWGFSATWFKPRPKWNPFHAGFLFTFQSIFLSICLSIYLSIFLSI